MIHRPDAANNFRNFIGALPECPNLGTQGSGPLPEGRPHEGIRPDRNF